MVTAAVAIVAALYPADAAAQRRIVRRGPVTRLAVGVGIGYPIYAFPAYAYPYFYDPFWWGYPGWSYQYYPGRYYYPRADLRIQVQPRDAEVYLDGYLVGNVDNFDGVFQRLDVPLGEHEVTIYAPAYHSITERMLFRPGESYKIKNVMQPLAAGEQPEARPAPSPRPQNQLPEGPPQGPRRQGPPEGPPRRGGGDARADQFGTLSMRVQPVDAEIVIDGERWDTPGGERIVVQLSEGTHRVEVRKDGYRPYTSTVRVRSGETTTLNVSLPSGGYRLCPGSGIRDPGCGIRIPDAGRGGAVPAIFLAAFPLSL
jgi:hypothetical protein